MKSGIDQSQYLFEAVRQVEGGVRLRLVQERLRAYTQQGRLPEQIAELSSRVEKTLHLWCNSAWMPGVHELIEFFVQRWPTSVPGLTEFFKERGGAAGGSIEQFAQAYLQVQRQSTADLSRLDYSSSTISSSAAGSVPAVCWLKQAAALLQWKQLSQDLNTLAVRRDLCDGLSQLKVSVENYNNSAHEQLQREQRLPSMLRNRRALKILENVTRVTKGVRESLSEIQVRVLQGTTSSIFRVGEDFLRMPALWSDADWPAFIMFELLADQDESFLELYRDGDQLRAYCNDSEVDPNSLGVIEAVAVSAAELANRLTLVCGLLRRLDEITHGLPSHAIRRAKLASAIGNLGCTLLGRYSAEIKLLCEPDRTQSSPWPFIIEDADYDQPPTVLRTGAMLICKGQSQVIVPPQVKLPVRLHPLYAVLHELATGVRGMQACGANACETFADRIKQLKIRGDSSDALAMQAIGQEWSMFERDLLNLVRELELIQGRALPEQVKRLVDEAFRWLKSEGFVVQRTLSTGEDAAKLPWEFQVLVSMAEDELPGGRIIQRRVVGNDGALVNETLSLQVSGAAGLRPIAKFLTVHEQDLELLQRDDSGWMSQHLPNFLKNTKVALQGDHETEIKVAVDFFSQLLERSEREPFRVRYHSLCASLAKTIQDDLAYEIMPPVDRSTLKLKPIDAAHENQLDVQWQYGTGRYGQVLKVQQFATPMDKGSVVASLGDEFPDRLQKLIQLQEAGAEFRLPSIFHEFEQWLRDLPRFYWQPSSFDLEWNQFREVVCEQARQAISSSNQDSDLWGDEWARLVLQSEPHSGTRAIFAIVHNEEKWFQLHPELDAASLELTWPKQVGTAVRGVRVISGGNAGQVVHVDRFGLKPLRANVTVYGGARNAELLMACDQLQSALKEVHKDLGRPMMTLLAAVRDPFVAPLVARQSIQECLTSALDALVYQEAVTKSIDAAVADSILAYVLAVTHQLGYEDQTYQWSFASRAIDTVAVAGIDLPFYFSEHPLGETVLHSFEVTEGPKRISVELTRSAGVAPPGFDQLASLLNRIESGSSLFVDGLRQALDALPGDVAMQQVTLQEQRAAEIWDLVTGQLPDLGNQPAGGTTHEIEAQLMEATLKLIEYFGLEPFGSAGSYMSAVATNRDYELWFDFDHAALAARAADSETAIDRIRRVVRPGLRRRNAPSPLRKAVVEL